MYYRKTSALSTFLALCAFALNAAAQSAPKPAAASTAEMEKTIIALEKKTWELWRSKNVEEGKKLEAPGAQAIYFGAIKSDQESSQDINEVTYADQTFSDWKVTFPVPGTAIVTYKSTSVASTYKGKDTSGTYLISSVWVNINGEWKAALYHETKAEPQPKK